MSREERPRFRVELDVQAGRGAEPPAGERPGADEPFLLAILGDFRGRGDRGDRGIVETGPPPVNRRPAFVDRDDFDDVIARLAPELELPAGERGEPVPVRFAEIDDFHPDRLYERLPLFRALRELRGRPPASPAAPTRQAPASGASVLDDILGGPVEGAAPPARQREDELQAFVRRVVAPHLVPSPTPGQAEHAAQVDAAIADRMRAILHDPAFQRLEALWRAVWLLVRRVETGEQLKVALFDVTRAELEAGLGAEDAPERSDVARMLQASAAGAGAPWAVLVAAHELGARDAQLAERLAGVGRALGAPWLADAGPTLVGARHLEGTPDPNDWERLGPAGWELLRRRPEAAYLGLALPRVLLREPYGAKAEPCERLAFEEVVPAGGPPPHDQLLWGSPAIACALLLAESFADQGWGMREGSRLDIGGLPLHVFRDPDGESRAVPCAEALLTERAVARIVELGVMPLMSRAGGDEVRLLRFQSVADPLTPLAGRWRSATHDDD
ncbi:MAG TPA: type VI secretion system contractile sheath large subunit [Gemmatimonadaceae bacterium]|nr:type VI secretion system contractile sheath large subunit [Gemmatimonadaceae bacterium]